MGMYVSADPVHSFIQTFMKCSHMLGMAGALGALQGALKPWCGPRVSHGVGGDRS